MTHSTDPDRSRLESWKEIAQHLGRNVRTVQRWERVEGLPVHRHNHAKTASVYAYRHEIDTWRHRRSIKPDERHADSASVPSVTGIVVLPFVNQTPDRDNEYFSDGLTDEIVTHLSRVRTLRVISRNSSMQLKGTTKDTRTIGRELNVQYLVHGSVRKARDALRISAQLIDAVTDAHLWAETYSGVVGDVFDLQERLARTIVTVLELTLSPDEERLIASRPIANVQAYECYLRARHEIYRFTDDSLARGQRLTQFALDNYGENELIYSIVGQAYLLYLLWGIKADHTYIDLADQCATKIFALNAGSAHGRALRGMVAYMRGHRVEAARLLQDALQVSPEHPDALIWLVSLYVRAGKAAPLKPLVKRLLDVDPLTPLVHSWTGWLAWLDEGPGPSLLEANRTTYEMDPRNPYSRFVYAWVLAMCRKRDEAVELIDALGEEAPDSRFAQLGLFFKSALRGERATAPAAVTDELEEWARHDDLASWWMTDCYALAGETDLALDWLENGVSRGFINYPALITQDPFLERLRTEPRFQEITRRVHDQWMALT